MKKHEIKLDTTGCIIFPAPATFVAPHDTWEDATTAFCFSCCMLLRGSLSLPCKLDNLLKGMHHCHLPSLTLTFLSSKDLRLRRDKAGHGVASPLERTLCLDIYMTLIVVYTGWYWLDVSGWSVGSWWLTVGHNYKMKGNKSFPPIPTIGVINDEWATCRLLHPGTGRTAIEWWATSD